MYMCIYRGLNASNLKQTGRKSEMKVEEGKKSRTCFCLKPTVTFPFHPTIFFFFFFYIFLFLYFPYRYLFTRLDRQGIERVNEDK